MDTPGPVSGPSPTLYGGSATGINRRTLLACGLILPLAARAHGLGAAPAVKALNWTGIGELPNERGINRLVLSTRVEPFVRASTESWFEESGPESKRRLVIEPDGGWVESAAGRRDLPGRQVAHERAQYGLYGYMLHAMAPGAPRHLAHPGLPPIDFTADAAGRLTAARYDVPHYANDSTMVQYIAFEGMVADKGVRWPQRITLGADAPPEPHHFNFRIIIDDFTVELA